MKNKIAQRILNRTPEDVKIYVKKYADIVVRIHEIMQEKGINQKELAVRMDKKPSEISKWLNGEHNFTMQTICKLEAELGETLMYIPKKKKFITTNKTKFTYTVMCHNIEVNENKFVEGKTNRSKDLKIA